MKKKQYLHTNFVKFLIEKYNKKAQNEEPNLIEDEINSKYQKTNDDETNDDKNEDDEPIEDLIAEYKDLYKKFEDKKYDAIFKRR